MNASLQYAARKMTILAIAALFVTIHSSLLADEQMESGSQFYPERSTLLSSVMTERTLISHDVIDISNDYRRPRAREDVESSRLIQTAVVPGRVSVPQPGFEPALPSTVPTYRNYDHRYNVPQAAPRPSQIPIDHQIKITSRFTDQKMLGFMQRTSMRELTTLFLEASEMIDQRHVQPNSYEDRMRAGLQSIADALENESFLKANRINGSSQNIRLVQSELMRAMSNQPARDAAQLIGVMQWASELVTGQLGIRREAVALEFMNGSIDSLDRYSSFLPEAAAYAPGADAELRQTAALEENIVGIGVELETHPEGAVLVGVIENSPAAQLGLLAGDLIVAVNHQNVQGLTLNEVASKLGGPVGTVITLDIRRDGNKYRGQLSRRSIYVGSVTGTKMVDANSGVGYVRLKQFSQSSRKDLEAALWSLHQQGMKSLILDLRGNPGGLLDQAIEVSNLFLPCGTIVSTKGRNLADNTQETAKYQQTWSVPLVVLIDDGSASASEIFAAAIQDNQRGIIVGRQSYGKGTVQTHFPLKSVSGLLKLTTAKFYAPNGREMAGVGVTPDVTVNEQTTGYRGTQHDGDIEAAIRVTQQGELAQLAAQAATCRKPPVSNNVRSVPNERVQQNQNWLDQYQVRRYEQ